MFGCSTNRLVYTFTRLTQESTVGTIVNSHVIINVGRDTFTIETRDSLLSDRHFVILYITNEFYKLVYLVN